jgi:hypothetical protein
VREIEKSNGGDAGRESAEMRSYLDLCEFAKLAQEHGAVTPQIWHEHYRRDTDRLNANRQFERIKDRLVERHIPHQRRRVEADGGGSIGIWISRRTWQRLAVYFPTVARPDTKFCRGCGEDLPIGFDEQALGGRLGGAFANDATQPDGLDFYCRACRRARSTTHHDKKGGREAKAEGARRYRATREGREALHRALSIHREARRLKFNRPTECQERTCGASGRTYAEFVRLTDDEGEPVLALKFYCLSCLRRIRKSEAGKD